MGNPRVMKRRKRSCKSKSSFFFSNLRYGRFNFFFDSAGFAGAFVDRIVETKGVSQVFFLSLSFTWQLTLLRAHTSIECSKMDFFDKEKAKRAAHDDHAAHFVARDY